MAKRLDMVETGRRIRSLRQKMGLTQAELADKIGITKGCIYNWENGKNKMYSIENAIFLCDFFGISLNDLIATKEV